MIIKCTGCKSDFNSLSPTRSRVCVNCKESKYKQYVKSLRKYAVAKYATPEGKILQATYNKKYLEKQKLRALN